MHIVMPYAAWQAGAADGLARPHLQAFLAASDAQALPLPESALDFYLPHDVLLAQLFGLNGLATGTVPWAAWQRAEEGLPSSGAWARISLCHWQMGMREARLHPPGPLAISQTQADALWHSLGEWLAQDGITLVPSASGAPFERDAQADWFADLPSVSMRRAAQGSLMDAAQKGRKPSAQKIARLQGEAQMLLYNHPVNAEREAQRLPAINAFWLDGAGALGQPADPPAEEVVLVRTLQDAAEANNLAAWRQAWLVLDEELFAPAALQSKLAQGGSAGLRISFCGLQGAQTHIYGAQSALNRIKSLFLKVFSHFKPSNLPEQLSNL